MREKGTITVLSTLLFANLPGAVLQVQTLILGAMADDPTGLGAAFTRIAVLFAGVIGGVIAFFVVVNGYMYITTSEESRGMYAKRAMGGLLFGAMLVILGANIAPVLVSAITGSK